MAPAETSEDRSAIDEAVEFIRAVLADGPHAYHEIRKAAIKAGISEATLKRAKQTAGAKSEHVAKTGGKRGKESGSGSWRRRQRKKRKIRDG